MSIFRWKISTKNRIGMVSDVVKVFSDVKINISSMEVYPCVIWIKFAETEENKPGRVKNHLLALADVINVEPAAILPQEKKEQQLRLILDTINEGIVAIDQKGCITHINPVADKLLRLKSGEVVGKNIAKVLDPDMPILKALKDGKPYNNQEIIIKQKQRLLHYFTTGRPIRGEKGEILGVVATIKGMGEIRDLVYKITKPSTSDFDAIVYCSASMDKAVQLAKSIAKSNSTVLVRGESGTGKELFARAIHESSKRNNKFFLPINCAALPEALLESELFGYEEGAFSGAKRGGKPGLFEIAHGGTLFLDEIGELSPKLQSKLLRVLQDGMVIRLGGHSYFPVDVRIIAATNRNLEDLIKNNEFRIDLFYRLNVIPINIPPLRERKNDIPLLIDFYLEKFNKEMGKKVTISQDVHNYLLSYDWPGNVRELENIVVRAFHVAEDKEISKEHLLLDRIAEKDYQIITAEESLKEAVSNFERSFLVANLKKHGSARATARALSLSHTAVLKKIQRYNLKSLLK